MCEIKSALVDFQFAENASDDANHRLYKEGSLFFVELVLCLNSASKVISKGDCVTTP